MKLLMNSFQYFVGLVGAASMATLVFWYVFSRYDVLEAKVQERVASDAAQIYDYLDRMYRRIPMSKCYLLVIIPAATLGVIGFWIGLRSGFLVSIILAGFLGTIGYKVPGLIVKKIFDRRVEKFDSQLVDALNMMSNAVKSGLSFMQVVQVIEREMPVPISEEFAMVLKENRVGVNLTDALTNMTKRIPSEDLFMIMNSVVTLSQAGGNLSEAFETIAKTIRERRRIHDRIKTLSQAAVTQGFLLTIIPLAQLGIQYIIQPQYAALLFTTNLGRAMLFVMFTMIALGGVWMKKILTIEI